MILLVLSSQFDAVATHEFPPAIEDLFRYGASTRYGQPSTIEELWRCVVECKEAYYRCRNCKMVEIDVANRDSLCYNMRSVCLGECIGTRYY